jgi:two-component sensor histidine kinase
MTSLKITKLESQDGNVTIEWESSLEDASLMSVVFDDDGSCTNIGVDPKAKSFSTSLIESGKYLVTVSALTDSGWEKSQTLVVEV